MGDKETQVGERPSHVVEQHGPPIHQHRVGDRRGREMDHHRDVELLRLREDGIGKVPVVDRVVVIHRIELQTGEPELRDRALQLGHRRLDAAILRVHGGHADELVGILLGQSCDVVAPLVDRLGPVDAGHAGDVNGPPDLVPRVVGWGDGEDGALVNVRMVADQGVRLDGFPQVLEARPIRFGWIAIDGQVPSALEVPQRHLFDEALVARIQPGREDVVVPIDDHEGSPPPGSNGSRGSLRAPFELRRKS